jgi:uncharacterized membrane protein
MSNSSGRLPSRQFRGVSYDDKVTHPLPDDKEDAHQQQPAKKKGEGWGRRTVECILLLMIIAIFIYGVFAAFNSATIAINVFTAIATGLALLIALISVSKGLLDDLCTLLDTPTYYFCSGIGRFFKGFWSKKQFLYNILSALLILNHSL